MQPANQLNIESLTSEWCDKDHVMLHACFQLLKDCIDKEKLLTGDIDWGADEKSRSTKAELENLYNWWSNRPNADNPDAEEERYKEDSQMLHRLIEIRWALWT